MPFPSELIARRTGTFTAGHLWDDDASGGSFLINASGTNRSALFDVEINTLNQDACVELASAISGASGPSGLVSTQINSVAAVSGTVAPEVAAGSCTSATANRLIFSYFLRQKGR